MEPEITENAVNGAFLIQVDMILVNMVYQMVSRHMHRHPSGWYSGLSSCGRITVAELLRILTGFPIYFLTASHRRPNGDSFFMNRR